MALFQFASPECPLLPDSPLASRFIQCRNYRKGRHSFDYVVLHSAEGNGPAANVANWFAGSQAPMASAHYVVGADEVVQCCLEADTAWHVPPVNATSIGIEHVGHASQTIWPDVQMDLSARLVADICNRRGIPAVILGPEDLLNGLRGITTHKSVSMAFHKSTHVDPGDGFDLDDYLRRVISYLPEVDADPYDQ